MCINWGAPVPFTARAQEPRWPPKVRGSRSTRDEARVKSGSVLSRVIGPLFLLSLTFDEVSNRWRLTRTLGGGSGHLADTENRLSAA